MEDQLLRESLKFTTVEVASLTAENVELEQRSPLFDIAEKRGIILPSPHLAVFKTVYAKIEEANGNGVRLAREGVLEALPTLIGKQVNLNHWRKGFIIGHIIDANLNEKDQIEVAFVFYKDVYIEDFDRAIAQFSSGKLSVSFELNFNKDFKESLSDGTVRLHKINFAGMGLLLDEEPAYKDAIVFEMAKKVKNRIAKFVNSDSNVLFANQINNTMDLTIAKIENAEAINKQWASTWEDGHFHAIELDAQGNGKSIAIFGEDLGAHTHEIKDWVIMEADNHVHEILQDLVNAMKANEEKGGKEMAKPTAEEIKKLQEELGDLCKDWSEDDFANEAKIAEARKVISDIEKDTEDKAKAGDDEDEDDDDSAEDSDGEDEAKSEETKEEAETKSEETKENAEEAKDESQESEKSEENKDEANKEEKSEEATKEEKPEAESKEEKAEEATKSEEKPVEENPVEKLTQENDSLKAKVKELEGALEAKTKEFDSLKSSIPQIQSDAVKVAELKKELVGFTPDFTDEDYLNPTKIKIARLEKENAELKSNKDNGEKKKEDIEVAADTGHKESDTVVVKNATKTLIDEKAGKYCAKGKSKGAKDGNNTK